MKTTKKIIEENREWAESVFEKLDKKLSVVTLRSRDKLPDGVDENGIHVSRSPDWWTSGFFGGLNWLMYEKTGKEDYLLTARRSEELLDAALAENEKLHHDVGFMWHILSGASYRLTGDVSSKRRNFLAAALLSSRYILGGGFIRAWNGKSGYGGDTENWTIIDTMMNLPLLYWASRECGDDRFARIAMSHADNAMRTHVRPDGSVAHIVEHDRETGDTITTYGGQGYSVGSSWSRGQAWAIYGFALSYLHSGKVEYLDTAKRVANYFISCVSGDWLTRLDFRAPEEPVYYDATASAIAAAGMIEIAKALPELEGGVYAEAAVRLLRAMEERFLNYDLSRDDLVCFGSVRYPALTEDKDGTTTPKITNLSIIYGDFFFTESILKLLGSEFNPW